MIQGLSSLSVIPSHHLYKDMLLPTPGEILYCRECTHDEAKQCHCVKHRNFT